METRPTFYLNDYKEEQREYGKRKSQDIKVGHGYENNFSRHGFSWMGQSKSGDGAKENLKISKKKKFIKQILRKTNKELKHYQERSARPNKTRPCV